MMKRKIIFRGKGDNGWFYGYVQLYQEKYASRLCICPVSIRTWKDALFYSVDENTVSQFTGLRDKNGKDIYEGDILGVDINGMNKKLIGRVEGGVRGYCYDVVYLNHPKGEERWSLYGTVIHDFPNRIEVIGNIYDNPELLKEE